MSEIYDTREGIENYLDQGLAGLHLLQKDRKEAGYTRKERLNKWIVLSRFYLDTCGNFMVIREGAPKYANNRYPPEVMTCVEAMEFTDGWSSTGFDLPPIVGECRRCLRGWDISNCHDADRVRVRGDGEDEYFWEHKECSALRIFESRVEGISDLFKKAEIECRLRAIPSQYGPTREWGPWFIADTDRGPIRIGWRKRVIHIDWSRTDIKIQGKYVVPDQMITHGEKYAHAWGYEAAVEYLKKLYRNKA